MNGWLIIFAVTGTGSGVWGSFVHSRVAVLTAALFGVLFLLGLCTKAVRRLLC